MGLVIVPFEEVEFKILFLHLERLKINLYKINYVLFHKQRDYSQFV